MAPLPTLTLARRIVKAYERDDFILAIIYGNLRAGKSAYALKVLFQVLQYLKGIKKLEPDHIRRYMGWEPRENVDQWLSEDERQPMFIWDDAGYWLHSMNWHDPLMTSIQQYFNVVGTDYNAMLLTTPSPKWVLSKIANMPGMIRIKIIKRDGGKSDAPSKMFARRALAYKPWESPDLKKGGVNKIFIDDYSCMIWEEVYEWYKPIRDHYARQAKLSILRNLNRKEELDEVNEMKLAKKVKRYKKDLGLDGDNDEHRVKSIDERIDDRVEDHR